jgi:hypothetical protein
MGLLTRAFVRADFSIARAVCCIVRRIGLTSLSRGLLGILRGSYS